MKYIYIMMLLLGGIMVSAQEKLDIWVDGNCASCKGRIEKAALQIMGVDSAQWDVSSKILTIEKTDQFYKDDLLTHLASIGYDTKAYKGDPLATENYSFCCDYIERKKTEIESELNGTDNLVTKELWVDGICGMCQDRIKEASVGFDEISFAFWDMESKMLRIDVEEDFDVMVLHHALANIGHDTKLAQASDEAYDNLHGCCKYRDEEVQNMHTPESFLSGFKNWDDSADHSNDVHGVIHELTKEGEKLPVIGASVQWLGTTIATSTDEQGFFSLEKIKETNSIVVQYIGSQPDTIEMGDQHIVNILIKSNFILDEISIAHKRKSTEISFLNTMKIRQIDKKELLKAACCSLSESFETTPSVDVSFTDAITGTRKIELLGLAGPNVQIMHENIPNVRGLAAINGLNLIPGPWVESMQLNIGSGSVINGPEALTGQINVETKKPRESERVYIGLYGNMMERFELNANTTTNINEQLSTAFIVHAARQNGVRDRNSDGFLDNPLSNQLFFVNRWKLKTKNNFTAQLGIKYATIDRTSGQSEQLLTDVPPAGLLWEAKQRTQRLEAWYKMGRVFENNPNRSFGFMLNYTYHNQRSTFGLKPYSGLQNSVYGNLIFSQLIDGTSNKLNYGVSYQMDMFQEQLNVIGYTRNEVLPGVFTEYNTSYQDKFDFVFGLRADYHNNYGLLINPRLHAKYAPSEYQAWRISAGRGIRTPSIFAENPGIFVSSRHIVLQGETDTPYGLGQEIAWNAGLSYTQEVTLNERTLLFGAEYYYTFFENNVLIDFDTDVHSVFIYNAENGTRSHSIQVHAEYEVLPDFTLKTAYRFNDVRNEFISGTALKPLISRHRAFLNASVELPNRWMIDGTFNVQGRKRIPSTASNPVEFQFDNYSPIFYAINGQVSKFFKKGFEAYLGVENALDFRQEDAIIQADNPFGEFFDASLIWGPVMGRNIYAGVRYRLFNDKPIEKGCG